MPFSDREAYWRGLLDEQSSSGESIAAFCRRRDVSQASFYSWRKRFRESEAASFVSVSVVGGSELEVQFPCGVTMRVPRDYELVRCVVAALRDRESDA